MRRALLLALLLAPPALAQTPPENGPALPEDLTLETTSDADSKNAAESIMAQLVVSSTKIAQRGAEVPAVVTVITSDMIAERGYQTLADVLSSVPGFYDVYDLVFHNFGVRGINGGARAAGSVIKVMIDGHPVDYRPSTGNFFGEELIPIQLIKRIEVIRGPASALYGANAFLGVVNIITRYGSDFDGGYAAGNVTLVREHPGGGGTLIAGGHYKWIDIVAGGNYDYFDRSGLGLPQSSPAVLTAPAGSPLRTGLSQNDLSRPGSGFLKLTLTIPSGGRFTLSGSLQNLDAVGEFQDYGPLAHGTRVNLINQNYRLLYDYSLSNKFAINIGGHYLNGMPGPNDRLSTGSPDYSLRRVEGVQGFGFDAESRIKAHRLFTLIVGADFERDDHTLQTWDRVLSHDVTDANGQVTAPAGSVVPGPAHGAHAIFYNTGAYVQGSLSILSSLSAIAGGRIDYHNVYGANFSARAGLVFVPGQLSLKLLYGASFKAPSAEQLYTQPIQAFDVQGNQSLGAQTAHTVELAGGYALPHGKGELTLNVFATDVIGRVEFVQQGLFLQARNVIDQWVVGGELDSRIVVVKQLRLRVSAALAETVSNNVDVLLQGQPSTQHSLFPNYQLHLIADWAIGVGGLHLFAEAAYVSARQSSQSNALIAGALYELPPYFQTSLALTALHVRILPKRDTDFTLRISNVLNTSYVEPGFGGIDIPAQGVTGMLVLGQQL